jgi:hypothetical protein
MDWLDEQAERHRLPTQTPPPTPPPPEPRGILGIPITNENLITLVAVQILGFIVTMLLMGSIVTFFGVQPQ